MPERIAMAQRHGIEVLDFGEVEDVPAAVRELTGGRGADSVIEAVGMEAHGTPFQAAAMKVAGMLPDAAARKATETFGVDRMGALRTAFAAVRRAGTVSIIGVYGGQADPFPMMDLFDKGLTLRMGQAHVKRWVDDIMPLLTGDDDPLGVDDLVTHRMPLEQAPDAYEMFKQAGRLHQGRVEALTDGVRAGHPARTILTLRAPNPARPCGGASAP